MGPGFGGCTVVAGDSQKGCGLSCVKDAYSRSTSFITFMSRFYDTIVCKYPSRRGSRIFCRGGGSRRFFFFAIVKKFVEKKIGGREQGGGVTTPLDPRLPSLAYSIRYMATHVYTCL